VEDAVASRQPGEDLWSQEVVSIREDAYAHALIRGPERPETGAWYQYGGWMRWS
jgi:hypothetical protein